MNYSTLAFTEAVKDMQEKLGSRKSYARFEQKSYVDGLMNTFHSWKRK